MMYLLSGDVSSPADYCEESCLGGHFSSWIDGAIVFSFSKASGASRRFSFFSTADFFKFHHSKSSKRIRYCATLITMQRGSRR